jgi:hypothetical protein
MIEEDRGASAFQRTERDGRVKYELAGRAVQGGDVVELCFSGGWVTGSFEWSGGGNDVPCFHYSIELMTDGEVVRGSLEIPVGAAMRWPG